MTYYLTSFEPERGLPRTTPEILCERCVDALRRDRYTWALSTEQFPAPASCPRCGVAYPKSAVPA